MTVRTNGFHHVAYRCRDAKQTVEFYNTNLGMDFKLAIAQSLRARGVKLSQDTYPCQKLVPTKQTKVQPVS